MFSKFAARRRGFTLIELLIVIVVIAILALIVIPRLMGASRKAKDSTLRGNLHILRNAVQQFEADCGTYPADLDQLIAAKDSSPNGADGSAVEAGTYKGPYLNSQGGIGGAGIPRNPYIASTVTDVTTHWTYTAATGAVTFATPDGTDAEGETYANY